MVLTMPFPLYGLPLSLSRAPKAEAGGSPSEMLLNDRPLLACVALWAVTVVVIIIR